MSKSAYTTATCVKTPEYTDMDVSEKVLQSILLFISPVKTVNEGIYWLSRSLPILQYSVVSIHFSESIIHIFGTPCRLSCINAPTWWEEPGSDLILWILSLSGCLPSVGCNCHQMWAPDISNIICIHGPQIWWDTASCGARSCQLLCRNIISIMLLSHSKLHCSLLRTSCSTVYGFITFEQSK